MASNQWLQYPMVLDKAVNGGYVVRDITDPHTFYAFSTQADLVYWIGLNEQQPAAPAAPADGTVNVNA
jgi:hypothetical protein